MAIIIPFTAAPPKGSTHGRKNPSVQRTPEEVRRFMLGLDDPEEEEEHFNLLFIPLDDRRTAVVGEVDKTQPFLERLQGTYQVCDSIFDPKGRNRGPGIILTSIQTLQFINLMEDDGWELNDEIHRVTEERYNYLVEQMRAAK